MCWSIDRHNADPGSQITFHDGHQITFLIWPVCFSKGLSTLDVQKIITKKLCHSFIFTLFHFSNFNQINQKQVKKLHIPIKHVHNLLGSTKVQSILF